MKKSGSFVLICAGVLMLGTVAVFTSRSLAQPKETLSISAAYVHGALRVSIPYHAPRTGEGNLLVEVLDPEDRPAASTAGHADANAGQGFWNRELFLPKSLPFDELVWHRLRYHIGRSLGPVEYVEDIRLEDKSTVLITTEKPIYQPGQTIHVRVLALDRANHQAVAGRQLTLEVDDPRGNKVFRKITQTDLYGLTSVEFSLADEVNLGVYHLRVNLNC